MEAIQYKGAVYVEASSHKKCKKGTHWNGIKHTCEKIPPELQKKIDNANTRSDVAKKATASKDHTKAWHRHNLASRAHHNAAQAAQKAGYWDLERQHRKKGSEHYKQMSHHAKFRKTTPPAPVKQKPVKRHWKDLGPAFDPGIHNS
jgi:hypothetical protein